MTARDEEFALESVYASWLTRKGKGTVSDMPKRYEQRLVQITIGQAVIPGGRPAWAVEEWNECTCPDCEKDGHWFVGRWFDTKEEAEGKIDGPYRHGGKAL